jgi:hypothetical protein
VAGERDAEQVADHAAVGTAGAPEAVRGERPVSRRGGALGCEAASAWFTFAAGDGPRHDDPVADRDATHLIADVDDLSDALMADRERAGEWDGTADVTDGAVDDTRLETGLHRARDVTMNRQRVAVAAAHDDGTHDRVGRSLKNRVRPLDPFEASRGHQVELAHGYVTRRSVTVWLLADRKPP